MSNSHKKSIKIYLLEDFFSVDLARKRNQQVHWFRQFIPHHFKHEVSSEKKNVFPDTEVFKRPRFADNKTLDVRTHYRPTETFQYTHFSSSNPPTVKRGFIKGDTLRLLRTTSVKETFKLWNLKFLTRFLEQGYPRELEQNILAEVKLSSRN